jgi:hypothetical protein
MDELLATRPEISPIAVAEAGFLKLRPGSSSGTVFAASGGGSSTRVVSAASGGGSSAPTTQVVSAALGGGLSATTTARTSRRVSADRASWGDEEDVDDPGAIASSSKTVGNITKKRKSVSDILEESRRDRERRHQEKLAIDRKFKDDLLDLIKTSLLKKD